MKSLPSRIGGILDIQLKQVERVLYSEAYVVLDPGKDEETGLEKGQVLSEEEHDEHLARLGNGAYRVGSGAEAVLELLRGLKVDDLAEELREDLRNATSDAARKKLQKRIKILEAFTKKNPDGTPMAKPEWMMLRDCTCIAARPQAIGSFGWW